MKTRSALLATFIAISGAAAAPQSDAVPVVVNAIATVTEVDIPDVFGTQVGDIITMIAKFDSTAFVSVPSLFGIAVPGVQFASLSSSPLASLSIDMRGQHWTAHDDSFFGRGSIPLPQIIFQFGKFVGLNFFGTGPQDNVFLNDARDSLYFGGPPGIIFGGNSDPDSPPFWIGFWDFSRTSVSVPEPDTLGLSLVGLVLLFSGVKRRLRGEARVRRSDTLMACLPEKEAT